MKTELKNGENLKDVIQETLEYIDICTEFWNQEGPVTWGKEEKINYKCISSSHSSPSEPAEFLLKSLEEIDEGEPNLGSNFLLVWFVVFILTVHLSM